MPVPIGHIEALYRYPVKSMRGERLDRAPLGWHGLEGDRRLALRRLDDRSGFPWLSASKLPELVRFTPRRGGDAGADALPTHVLTPEGEALPAFGESLASRITRRGAGAVEMTHLRQGVFDDASISVITSTTVSEVCRLAATAEDVRRFRPNILVRSARTAPFEEDGWLGGVLAFGESADAPAVTITTRDVRCAMLNIDPDDASIRSEMLKAVVRANGNNAGVYATVTRIGELKVGQPVVLHR